MYDIKMKHHFIALRAKGWSFSRTADHLHVSRRTLVDWNHESIQSIRPITSITSKT
jgi:transposase-like protein